MTEQEYRERLRGKYGQGSFICKNRCWNIQDLLETSRFGKEIAELKDELKRQLVKNVSKAIRWMF